MQRARVSTQVSSWLNFTPLSLSPTLWLDASDTTTITASNGSVSQWNDKSGNNYTFTQGTGAAQPTTGTRTQNGLNVLDFDGGDSLISTAAASTWTFLHSATTNIVSFVFARDAAGTAGTILATANGPSSIGFQFRFLATDLYSNIAHNGSSAVCINEPSSGTSTNAISLGIFTNFGNATALNRSIIYPNKSNGGQTNTQTATPTSSAAPVSLTIGNRQTSAIPLDGFIGEIVIVPAANATLNNLFLLQSYLVNKWGTA